MSDNSVQTAQVASATAKDIAVTAQAITHIEQQIQKNGQGLGLRVAVKKEGCSGLKYALDYVNEVSDKDYRFPLTSALSLFVDKQSFPFLKGLTIDLVTEGLNKKLKFINPNEVNACGCGESFSVSPTGQ